MELKDYQKRVIGDVEKFIHALRDQYDKGNADYASPAAWKAARISGKYLPRETGDGRDLPSVCIKVPTGGGKTLLATQALGSVFRILLRERNDCGLVLWVVPTSQIYRDTLRALRDPNHGYRMMLAHAVGRRIEVWEKTDIARLSPARLKDCLNVLVIQLASTNRKSKDDLKFFRDSGGNIVDHFPPEDDWEAHRKLKEAVPNLDMIEADEKSGRYLCATSIGNLVRLCRPPVILDEGHKAYSTNARATIEGFNPTFVLELSATPPDGANIVSRVSGDELLREEMIKLPLNVRTSGKKKWQDVLTEARDKREHLARLAHTYESAAGPGTHIRPIVLVQVERTGKEQRGKGSVHSEDVREYLRQKLDVPEANVKVKSAEDDELADVDNLMDAGCPVEWIITKSALQEGWDCPFAYVLVSLDRTRSDRALTQLVGRVLRQPYQKRAEGNEFAGLNESYAFCLHDRPAEVLKGVKKALENEGYEGEASALIRQGDGPEGKEAAFRDTIWRDGITALYGQPFEGKIYLPKFCVKVEAREDSYEPLDYYRHLVSRVDIEAFDYPAISHWHVTKIVAEAKEKTFRITLGNEAKATDDTHTDNWESDESVCAWLAANIDFPYLSHKQIRIIIERAYGQLCLSEMIKGRLATVKTEVRKRLSEFVQEQVDIQTESAFGKLVDAGTLLFYLHCSRCRFEIPENVRIEARPGGPIAPLAHSNGDVIAKSLFDFVESEGLNQYEREVALVLDRDANVLWWYRNKVGPGNFDVQGFRRGRIYPDFVAQRIVDGRELNTVWVIESKGGQLEGNRDTQYKRRLGEFFSRAGTRVTWQQLGAEFKDHKFRFQVLDEHQDGGALWADELRSMLSG
jgi:type III restriction enzyme